MLILKKKSKKNTIHLIKSLIKKIMTKDRYDSRGVSADKKDVHDSIKKN